MQYQLCNTFIEVPVGRANVNNKAANGLLRYDVLLLNFPRIRLDQVHIPWLDLAIRSPCRFPHTPPLFFKNQEMGIGLEDADGWIDRRQRSRCSFFRFEVLK